MPQIELSQDTFEALQELAEPLVDDPDSVVRRLIQEHRGRTNGEESPLPDGRRARKGEKTPNEAFYGPIVKVLREAGGELQTGEAVDRVGELMEDEFTELDRAQLKSGEIRWRNTVRFARHDLVKMGKLAENAPFGVWRLADSTEDE